MRRQDQHKTCARCGRRFSWRARWADCWEEVRYCSARCRGRRTSRTDVALERAILELLAKQSGTSICPSEAARAVDAESWRDLMQRTRDAARRLADREQVEVCQRGRRVDPSAARGPIRLARGPRFGEVPITAARDR